MPSRTDLTALALALVLASAGRVGTPSGTPTGTSTGTPTGTPTTTPLPPESVDLPDGPKDPPERPSTLNESSVREYVRGYEYRYAYNSLWLNEHTDVTLDRRVDGVSERPWGHEAVVTCTGHSDTETPETSTATPGPHADWFTQSYRYRVSDDATHRDREENRETAS